MTMTAQPSPETNGTPRDLTDHADLTAASTDQTDPTAAHTAATTQPAQAVKAGGQEPMVLVVMGVSGTGKSTVAGILAGRLGWDLEEGDDLHPASNVAKMASGQPLDDDDRWPWLDRIAAWINDHLASGRPGVVTCSALRRRYRDRLRGGGAPGADGADGADGIVFVHLSGTREQIFDRLSKRLHHFMPTSLLDSQLAALEPLEPDENGIVVEVGRTSKKEAKAILQALGIPLPEKPAGLDS